MTYSNANFTPGLKGYSNVKPFRFWCQKVLPLVYDDSLSYYELLCKVVDYLNNVISDLSATEDNVGDLLTAYNQLQDYVNNYFTNLDVQEEINTKLDAMFDDGTIPTMIEEYVDPFIETLNEHYDELDNQISETMDTQNANIATIAGRVDNLVVNNTTNLTGYNVVTVEEETGANNDNVDITIPLDAKILEISWAEYIDINRTKRTDNMTYVVSNTTATQQTITVTITDETVTRSRVFMTYAVSQSVTIAELTDIRTGYDGTVYSSAGNAVRTQVRNLKNGLDEVSAYAINHVFEWQEGYRIATNTAVIDITAIYPSPAYSCQVLEVLQGETFKLTAHADAAIYNAYCFTDTERNNLRISGAGTFEDYEITAPQDGYLIVCTDDNSYRGLTSDSVLPELVSDNAQNKNDIAELKFKCNNIESLIFPQSMFEQGTFGASGSKADSPYAIRTKDKIKTTRSVKLIPSDGYRVLIILYDQNGIFEELYNWRTETFEINANKYYQYAISHATPTQITSLSEYNKALTINSSYDEYLLHSTMSEKETYNLTVRENAFKYNAGIFGTESNDYGTQYNVGENEEYSTISAAIAQWATDGYPNATVFISNGEYNESITVEDKTIRFIGESRDGTIVHTTSGDYTDPPFNIRHGNVTIKNMTLIADHSENSSFDYESSPTLKAYGIHIDGGNIGGIVTVENCTIISFQAPAVGTGTIPNSKIRLINCECYCYTDYTNDTSSHQYYQLGLGCILWHTSNPEIYTTRGDESFEMVNVKAYMKNNYIVFKTNKSATTDTMDTVAINTLLVSDRNPNNQVLVSGPVNPSNNSIGNNVNVLNYE